MKPLEATARLQFHKDFTLDQAADLVDYFERLGVTHLYASPLLTARAGSTHGYDLVDPHRINPELGGEEALRRLVGRLRERQMGLILDIVPNHMGVGGSDNAWWLDVLEWGRASPYAEYFDIDWDPPDPTLRGRLLAPFLGSAYGDCLEAGELELHYDGADGRFFVSHFEHRFPIAPRDYAAILLTEGGRLETPARAFAELGTGSAEETRAAAEAARAELRQGFYRPAIDEAVAAYSPKHELGRDRLHRLLERQPYRLAWWRAASDEINWRRFFDVTSLAGIRQEVPAVFEDTHRTIFALYEEGLIDGVRIDHVDGLAYPRDYCRKLRRRMETLRERRPVGLQALEPVIWVEKILAPGEDLATDWNTDGTTGYDFMSDVSGLLHDPAGEAPLTALWTRLTGRPASFETEAQAARRQILRESLASEWFNTAIAVHRIARRNLSTRDYTQSGIRGVLLELLVQFRTYRIYAGFGSISEADQRQLDRAMAEARANVRTADLPLLDRVEAWLSGRQLRETTAGTLRQEWEQAMVRFQQLSAPTAAKSVEDTAFYRYGRLLSRNEVGSEPSVFAVSPADFHAGNRKRQLHLPRALLATATHDHKRGEDTRARLAVLSEVPGEWQAALERWMRRSAATKRDLDGAALDAADEIMLYQMLVAAWPYELSADDKAGLETYRDRVSGWLEKALREAKRHTSWTAQNAEYEAGARAMLAAALDPSGPLCADLCAFAARVARPGAINSFGQTLLRLTAPGVPDLYQGTEFWDFSLVDPDNRRPVDFGARERALAEGAAPSELLGSWRDGRVKQAVIARALSLRARAPGLFGAGSYAPLVAEGAAADHILAFVRVQQSRAAVVAIVRRAASLTLEPDVPAVSTEAWGDTTVLLPPDLYGRSAADVLGGSQPGVIGDRIAAATLFERLPIALLEVT